MHPVERAVLERFRRPGEAATVFGDARVATAAAPLRETLERHGLLPDAAVRAERWGRLLLALVVLVASRASRSRSRWDADTRNVDLPDHAGGDLLHVGVRRWACARARVRGEMALADLRHLFDRLRSRALQLEAGARDEALLLAAVFGLAVLPTPWAYAREFFPRAAASATRARAAAPRRPAARAAPAAAASCGGGGCGGGCGGCGS